MGPHTGLSHTAGPKSLGFLKGLGRAGATQTASGRLSLGDAGWGCVSSGEAVPTGWRGPARLCPVCACVFHVQHYGSGERTPCDPLSSQHRLNLYTQREGLQLMKRSQVEVLTQQPHHDQCGQSAHQEAGDQPEREHRGQRQGWKEAKHKVQRPPWGEAGPALPAGGGAAAPARSVCRDYSPTPQTFFSF